MSFAFNIAWIFSSLKHGHKWRRDVNVSLNFTCSYCQLSYATTVALAT
jgi:hypothetical protein